MTNQTTKHNIQCHKHLQSTTGTVMRKNGKIKSPNTGIWSWWDTRDGRKSGVWIAGGLHGGDQTDIGMAIASKNGNSFVFSKTCVAALRFRFPPTLLKCLGTPALCTPPMKVKNSHTGGSVLSLTRNSYDMFKL